MAGTPAQRLARSTHAWHTLPSDGPAAAPACRQRGARPPHPCRRRQAHLSCRPKGVDEDDWAGLLQFVLARLVLLLGPHQVMLLLMMMTTLMVMMMMPMVMMMMMMMPMVMMMRLV